MTFWTYLVLFILALIPPVVIAQFQPVPGYLDFYYYYAGGIQLVTGKGFTEPYMWNYLDGSTSLPHPSHGYWQPLASIIAVMGMWLTGRWCNPSARLFYIDCWPCSCGNEYISPIFSHEGGIWRSLLHCSQFFQSDSAPFMGVTDNFGIFMLLGGLYFILSHNCLKTHPDSHLVPPARASLRNRWPMITDGAALAGSYIFFLRYGKHPNCPLLYLWRPF